ncbi:MAG: hypothetical protein G8D28_06425 [gamma proteobacterium symbiont of Phacoides pectinatus]
MTTLFVKRLTVIDLSYLCPQRGLVGESWQVDLELDGSLDHQGMVLDFGKVKRQVKQTIDERFDHKLLYPDGHTGCLVTHTEHRSELRFELDSGCVILHGSPRDALTPVAGGRIDASALAGAIVDALRPQLPDNVMDIRVQLHTERIDGAFYQYSHGLKHHTGNCQRIAHGHRSRIEILRDGQRDPALEQSWAARWRDIYLGTRGDLVARFSQHGTPFLRFGYTANQGMFTLELPEAGCYLVDSDTTVENLAQHIADTLKRAHPESSFRVLAYEGVDKGAVGSA